MDQTHNTNDWKTLLTWLWRRLPLMLSKQQFPTTVLFRTTLTRTITLCEQLILQNSNHILWWWSVSSNYLATLHKNKGKLSGLEGKNFLKLSSLRKLLKTATGSRNKSPSMRQRPSSAGGMKFPDSNDRVTKTRCKSAQAINRACQQIPTQEKKGLTLVLRFFFFRFTIFFNSCTF